ncbi:hypothetical protein KKA15_05340 [Patescibacteria group bacterium]|nr:hypothetical protein [Patescibacteria group bacterium]
MSEKSKVISALGLFDESEIADIEEVFDKRDALRNRIKALEQIEKAILQLRGRESKHFSAGSDTMAHVYESLRVLRPQFKQLEEECHAFNGMIEIKKELAEPASVM